MSNQQSDTSTGRRDGVDWPRELADQLEWHWTHLLRPRLSGLTDAEYFAEPVPGWSLRPRGATTTPVAGGAGDWQIEFDPEAGTPGPFTTIAWRLGHMIVGVLAQRNASHFGRDQVDYFSYEYAPTAAGALAQLDEEYEHWVAAVRDLTDDQLARPVGPAEGPYAELSLATLVLHSNRELIHHGAEVALLRDLYHHRGLSTSRD